MRRRGVSFSDKLRNLILNYFGSLDFDNTRQDEATEKKIEMLDYKKDKQLLENYYEYRKAVTKCKKS